MISNATTTNATYSTLALFKHCLVVFPLLLVGLNLENAHGQENDPDNATDQSMMTFDETTGRWSTIQFEPLLEESEIKLNVVPLWRLVHSQLNDSHWQQLGLNARPLDSYIKSHIGLAEDQGILIYDLDSEGKAYKCCLLYTSPSPRDRTRSRMPSSA